MFREHCCDRQNDFNANFEGYNDVNMDVDINVENSMPMAGGMQMPTIGNVTSPIIEPVQERVVQRTIMHEVPHVCPIRTRIINNHVYRHTYRPSYSCCSQDTVSNIQCGSCCGFNK
ncbi:MAG: CotD family spore coat protein [bacterium]|nr:CotD family spore coat protein [bacterium]